MTITTENEIYITIYDSIKNTKSLEINLTKKVQHIKINFIKKL